MGSGFGIKTSERHISTHRLHPVHIPGSKSIALFGVGRLGSMYVGSLINSPCGQVVDLAHYCTYLRDRNEGCNSPHRSEHTGGVGGSQMASL